MSPDFTWLFIKMIAALVVVMTLALVLFRFILPRTRLGQRRVSRDWVTIEAIRKLDHRRSLYLVKIGERFFVLGAGEGAVSLITEMSAAEGDALIQGT